jgi:preprotein translocase subunit SecG
MRRGINQRENQSGFSTTVILLAILIVAALAMTGFVVYQRHKNMSATLSSATHSTQTTTQPKGTTGTQVQQITYLTITEWGVKLHLFDTIKDAYYSVGGNVGADGLPNIMWLGLASLDNNRCTAKPGNPSNFKPVGAIVRVLPTDKDPGTGKLYFQQYPNGTTINGYYYGYESWISGDSSCASATTLQSIDSAFATAARSVVPAQYLTIKEWGVRLTLDSTTASMYYFIKPDLPNVAYLSLKAVSYIAPDCAANETSLGAIVRETPTEQQSAPDTKYSVKGTTQIGNYWYGFSTPQAACINATQDVAVQKAVPGYSREEIGKAFSTLAADPASN